MLSSKIVRYTILLFVSGLLSCQNTPQSQTEDPLQARVEHYLQLCAENGLSGAVLVAKEGKVLFSGGLGLRNRQDNLLVEENTVFTTGSITKQFTATAILKLEEEGLLSVNDSISQYFDNLPAEKQNITIHQLLTHTSGIIGNLDYGQDFTPIAEDVFLQSVFEAPLDFEPGTQHSYANIGYSLLALIIERLSGQDYETYMQSLFAQAGMEHTGYIMPDWEDNQMAHGYKCGEDWGTHLARWQSDSNQISLHLKGNGGVLSTIPDLYKWYTALTENSVISALSFDRLTSPYVLESPDGDSHYAYGWAIFNSPRNTKMVTHNGSNGIFFADFLMLPEEEVVIIYMTNQLRYHTFAVAWELEKLIFEETYEPVVPQMNHRKLSIEELPNQRIEAIHKFTELILNTDTTSLEIDTEQFINIYLTNSNRKGRYQRFLQILRDKFAGYTLKHILEYDDLSYDIILESPEGEVTDLIPCYDLQFDEDNQIVAYGM